MQYFIIIFLSSLLYASDTVPQWAHDLVLTDRTNVYVGIGFSSESKEEATNNAFKEFSSSIKVTIDSETVVSSSEETKGRETKEEESFSSESRAITEEKLRGVTITGYWQGDGGQGKGHYILVVYDRDEYHANNEKLVAQEFKRKEDESALVKQEIKQEIELDNLESDKKLRAGKNKQKQAAFKEEERDRKREKKNKREQRKVARIKKLMKKYPDFPEGKPPYRLIDSFTGESTNNTHSIIVKGTIKPALINEFGYTYRFGVGEGKKFNISIDGVWDKIKAGEDEYDNHFAYMKNHIKFDFFGSEKDRISGSLGLAQYIYNDNEEGEDDEEQFFEYSFFMSANYGFWGYLTDVGGYIDKESVYLNLIHYPLYSKIQERLAVILELSCLFDERLRDDSEKKTGLQFGVLFKTSDIVTTKFTYENYEDLMLSIEFDL